MPLFIKTERFKKSTLALLPELREKHINDHKKWVAKLKASGETIFSGYLINQKGEPGGGGLLIIKANCFREAKLIIEEDPMIKNHLVTWSLKEWILVSDHSF